MTTIRPFLHQPSLSTTGSPQPEHRSAAEILHRRAQNPSAFLALNEGTQHFTVAGVDALIASQPAGRSTIVQRGGVFAAPDAQSLLLGASPAPPPVPRRKVVAVQLLRAD